MPEAREARKSNHILHDFGGVNTQSARQTIKDNEFSWLENIMPIGHGNLKVVPGPTLRATITGKNIYYMRSVSINNVDFMLCFATDGSAHKVKLTSPFTVTQFAAPGVFSGSGTKVDTWNGSTVVIIDSGSYQSYDGTTLTNRGGVTSAPSSGSAIAVFSGRVWIATGRTVLFSAPNSFTDFQTASFGGSFLIQDATLHSNIIALAVANNFLYVFGTDSINVISDVRVVTVGASTSTVFSNTNVSSSIGCTQADSISAYYRSLWFANSFGFYTLYGATTQKASDNLDGVFPKILSTGPITSGLCVLYNVLVQVFSFQFADENANRNLLAVFFNKKWFFASQGNAINYVENCDTLGVPTLYGTDGGAGADTHLYEFFADTAVAIATKVETKLWDMDETVRDKQVLKLGIELTPSTTAQAVVTATVDSEFAQQSVNLSLTSTITWVNNSGAVVTWLNNALQTVVWLATGFGFYKSDASLYGKYIGVTLQSASPQYVLNGILLQYELRASW